MYTIKNSLDWLACGLFTTEEIISKLEERTKEIPQNVAQRDKKQKICNRCRNKEKPK